MQVNAQHRPAAVGRQQVAAVTSATCPTVPVSEDRSSGP